MAKSKTNNVQTLNAQRAEIHKAIWDVATRLRGAVDGWDFKNYVLGFMFYRFQSEKLESYINNYQEEVGEKDFDYSEISDDDAKEMKEEVIKDLGYFILPSQLFCNVLNTCRTDKDLNVNLTQTFKEIENTSAGTPYEDNFIGLFSSIDLNKSILGKEVKDKNDRICGIIEAIAGMNLGNIDDDKVDRYGDAYEFLMSMYASAAGKSGGEFFTPQFCVELVVRLGLGNRKSIRKVYDPTCGSGSMLIKTATLLGKNKVGKFYGQEINDTTYNGCRMNMHQHKLAADKWSIFWGDTLKNPAFKEIRDEGGFDLITMNPPYSIHWEGDDNKVLEGDERFTPAGVLAPKSKADYAFIMHALNYLSEDGAASIVVFPGILYRGGAEQKIRKYLVENNFVDTIIQLPSNLFFGTSIATCIMVIKKNKTDNKTVFVDASNEFVKATNNNLLSEENINNIVKQVEDRKEIEHKVHIADIDEIKSKDFNLSVSTYVEPVSTEEVIDPVKLEKDLLELSNSTTQLLKEIEEIKKEFK